MVLHLRWLKPFLQFRNSLKYLKSGTYVYVNKQSTEDGGTEYQDKFHQDTRESVRTDKLLTL